MSDPKDHTERRAGNAPPGEDLPSDLAEEVDPALVARLEAWFAGPATSFLPAEAAAEPRKEDPKRREARERALAAVDPQLLARIEGQGDRADELVSPTAPPEPTIDPSIARFEPRAWRLDGIGEPRDFERPEDIPEALRERTPQAILRDLHRPVRHYGGIYLRPLDIGLGRPGARSRAMISELVSRRYAFKSEEEPTPRRMMRQDQERLRGILSQPWGDSRPENPRPVPSGLPDANDMKWFGTVGIDPDQ